MPIPHDGSRAKAVDASDKTLDALRVIAAAGGGDDEVRAAVDDARLRGVSWQSIGAVLGINRGAAYQRYRPRHDASTQDDS